MKPKKYLFNLEGKRIGATKFIATSVVKQGFNEDDARKKIFEDFEPGFRVTGKAKELKD